MTRIAFLFVILVFGVADNSKVSASKCKTSVSVIQPQQDIGEDGNRYTMINIPGFEQNATSVECLSNQTCTLGTCQQDYKLHQFLTVPHGKQQFELDELKFRLFKIPYGCKCAA
ncbi:uncharacterized protein LOC106641521 [Copidosoma floridanum]|uniref:uncharacterized protein LOC106641521 n=1 Tax=Copidosoma floridanum TaxID=29053 RepID=UPI0006C9B931|nr:uncharacterized protein LOC106641521 [Copidosoma floridanum]